MNLSELANLGWEYLGEKQVSLLVDGTNNLRKCYPKLFTKIINGRPRYILYNGNSSIAVEKNTDDNSLVESFDYCAHAENYSLYFDLNL